MLDTVDVPYMFFESDIVYLISSVALGRYRKYTFIGS